MLWQTNGVEHIVQAAIICNKETLAQLSALAISAALPLDEKFILGVTLGVKEVYDGFHAVWLYWKGAYFLESFYMKMNSGWDRGHSFSTTFTDKDFKLKIKDRKFIHLYPVYFTSHKKPSLMAHLK